MASVEMMNVPEQSWLKRQIDRGRKEIFTVQVDLTPALAGELLAINDANRPLNKGRIEAYRHDMLNGKWVLNGETIIVSSDGTMNDGQHRCHAVIPGGVTVPVILIFGLSRESRLTTNQGKAKGAGDYAGMLGISNAKAVAAIARMVLTWKTLGKLSGSRDVSHSDVLEFIEQNDAALQHAHHVSKTMYNNSRLLGASSITGFCFYICNEIAGPAAEAFFHALGTGENLSGDDPILTARNRLFSLSGEARYARVEIILRAWNAWREGRTLRMVPIMGNVPAPV